jgi:diphthamide biosynthesis protein 4
MTYMPTYYEILGLPEALHNESNIPAQTLRGAYRRALLQNHPDKCAKPTLKKIFSIDQISEAFSVLSNSTSRAKYNKDLQLHNNNVGGSNGAEVFRIGVEIIDLDDLDADEAQRIWYRSCRCGDERGFLISEADLEEAANEGELSVGCKGCSLWLKVLFGVMEDEVDDSGENRDHTRT